MGNEHWYLSNIYRQVLWTIKIEGPLCRTFWENVECEVSDFDLSDLFGDNPMSHSFTAQLVLREPGSQIRAYLTMPWTNLGEKRISVVSIHISALSIFLPGRCVKIPSIIISFITGIELKAGAFFVCAFNPWKMCYFLWPSQIQMRNPMSLELVFLYRSTPVFFGCFEDFFSAVVSSQKFIHDPSWYGFLWIFSICGSFSFLNPILMPTIKFEKFSGLSIF